MGSAESNAVNVSVDTLLAYPVLCVELDGETTVIKRSRYVLDLNLGLEPQVLGVIQYDAAFVNIPHLTNFSKYRQRIFMVNNSGFDIPYTTTFIAEEAVKGYYEPRLADSGVIPAGQTVKITSDELLSIADGVPTRISARMYFDAKLDDVSAAVQIFSVDSTEPPVTNIIELKKL
ncbi:hypothetical protein IC617_10190 [Neiella sp. HB171785]|uniref:Uncharacterized protein n=1 Tax=Neiella litorisoli TaxID=2771431 RepID=A0A8J6QQZ7_9GAMM|nr:hypothetical protein [Neiella litorisoli]MBD1389796.1 hypothetical protein [Neiella litorisoli]